MVLLPEHIIYLYTHQYMHKNGIERRKRNLKKRSFFIFIIIEAIDEGQNKLALQHTTKLLKKNPDWPLVKVTFEKLLIGCVRFSYIEKKNHQALKAVIFVRTGKDDEAIALCQQVKKTIPTDNATLQACTMAYNELGQRNIKTFCFKQRQSLCIYITRVLLWYNDNINNVFFPFVFKNRSCDC